MKNLFRLLAVVLCLCFSLPVLAKEKIDNFEVHFDLHDDNSAIVKEYITFTAENSKVLQGRYRILYKDIGKNIKVENLTLDAVPYPYDIEKEKDFIKINFGTDEFLANGEHTYVLTYTLDKIVKTTFAHDILTWPVADEAWTSPIDQVSFHLKIPYSVKPIIEKVTTENESVNITQIEENIFIFDTFKPLQVGDTFTIYFPMKKGVFKFKWYEVKYMPVFVCLLIIIYYFIVWYLVGRDPKEKLFATRFSPPKNVSAGFASYFLNGPFSSKNLATVFASLIVKKRIKITSLKRGAPQCEKLDGGQAVLDEDEIRLLMCLPSEFKLDKYAYPYLEKGLLSINHYYESQIDNYVINNFVYMLFPIIAFVGMLYYFYSRGVISTLLFAMVFNFLIPVIIGIYTRNIKKLISIILILMFGTGIGVSSILSSKFLLNPNVIAILVTVFLTALFVHLVNNLMLDGAILRDELAAFKRYMFTAEKGRVALSKPSVAGQIFCDYLPYAYAFGMESKWFKKFENKIDIRLKDTYDSLTTSSVLNVGLFVTILAIMDKGKENLISSTIINGISGNGLGGGR